MKRKRGLQADVEKVREWKQRSAARARERARNRKEPRLDEAVRQAMSKANPPRPDSPEVVPKKRRKEPNPGNNPTPPLPPRAKCACGCGKRAVHNHHVVYRQMLRVLRADASDPRSCVPMAFACHGNHHGTKPLPLTKLTDENYAFAMEVLGPACYDYLRKRYSGDDPRLDAILSPDRGDQR